MKLEHHSVAPSLLEEEARIYQSLARKAGFPRVYWHGQQDDFMVLVFELLGPNLEDLFRYCGDQFSLKTTLMLADQLLHRFESLHSHNYLHRDVKPENFLQGMGEAWNIIYMTDLGLAIYRHPDRWISNSPSSRDVTAGPPQLLGNMQICKHQRAFRYWYGHYINCGQTCKKGRLIVLQLNPGATTWRHSATCWCILYVGDFLGKASKQGGMPNTCWFWRKSRRLVRANSAQAYQPNSRSTWIMCPTCATKIGRTIGTCGRCSTSYFADKGSNTATSLTGRFQNF